MATILTNDELIKSLAIREEVITALTTAEGSTYESAMNEFLEAVVNKIVYQKIDKLDFTNPFRKYYKEDIAFGDTIENIWVTLPKGYKYDPKADNPFTQFKNEVKTLYGKITFQDQYCVTINRDVMRKAFLNEYGLMRVINDLIESLRTSIAVTEYQYALTTLNNANIYANGIEEIDVSTATTDKEKSAKITYALVSNFNDMLIPSANNNKMKVLNTMGKDDALLIIKQSVLDKINLDFLTGVYNLDKVGMIKNIIPVRNFRPIQEATDDATLSIVGDDIDFVIIDSRGLDFHDVLQSGGYIYNPKGRYGNYYSDSWEILAYKYWYNARAFKIKESV